MFIVIMAVAGLGFLMKYVLLPGYKINELYDAGTELFFWGLDRHQWGAIHLYLALFLVFLLILHIILHWGSINSIFQQMIPGKTVRIFISIFVGVIALFLALAPLNVKPEIAQLQRKHNRNRVSERSVTVPDSFQVEMPEGETLTTYRSQESREQNLGDKPVPRKQENARNETDLMHRHNYDHIDIDGTMTLSKISATYNISVNELAKVIKVPVEYANERLGRLKRRYGFELDDLREFVLSKSAENDK
jgi:hypothetical protein